MSLVFLIHAPPSVCMLCVSLQVTLLVFMGTAFVGSVLVGPWLKGKHVKEVQYAFVLKCTGI